MTELRSLDELTQAVEAACEVAAIDVEIHELDLGASGWVRSGETSPLRRLVRCLRSAGLLDERSDRERDEAVDWAAVDRATSLSLARRVAELEARLGIPEDSAS